MSDPWRTPFVTGAWTLLGHPRRGLESSGIDLFARGGEDESATDKAKAAGAASSIIVGVLFCLFLVALAGLAVFYYFKRQRTRVGDVETAEPEKKRNWFAVEGGDEKKGGFADWWRQSHSIPDRVEPPPSARPRTSLQRLKSALSRKGAQHRRTPSTESETGLLSKFSFKVTSPTVTIDLPMQTVPQPKPRYPSVLERGYRVPLYPVQSPPQENSPPRSLTSPAPPPPPSSNDKPTHPITVAERSVRKKLTLPPRALKISNGRPLVPISERKMGVPRSPAHRQRRGLMNQFKHPFLPLKDSDTAFPTISAPMPSADNGASNPKLGYAANQAYAYMQKPRIAPMHPGGPRQLSRVSTRRIPVPVYETKPSRPLLPATPLHLREDVRVLPPGSPSVHRPAPTPI
ncbi:hypothetical protein D9611_007638 [Ephemerocybe angulata]|uniref:Uncharacterized protein n=1 Tax=Ephemerocybe angulata TaxID=980116 RepID=A0A8H5BY10_9AGAR|nr:hypothetical protein D9611_007638 [Tulosesus angulatus]